MENFNECKAMHGVISHAGDKVIVADNGRLSKGVISHFTEKSAIVTVTYPYHGHRVVSRIQSEIFMFNLVRTPSNLMK